MALSYTQKTPDNSLITKYVRNRCPTSSPVVIHTTCGQESLYNQFGTYLVQNGLYIASQPSSDSYAGELWNQTNLAVKVWLSNYLVDSSVYDLDPTFSSSPSSHSRPHLKFSGFSEITTRANNMMYAALFSPRTIET